jgi:hypothetical protein
MGSCSSVRGQLGDPGAHRAGAEDPYDGRRGPILAGRAGLLILIDGLGLRHGLAASRRPQAGTSALMPVIARPMISFWICEVPS